MTFLVAVALKVNEVKCLESNFFTKWLSQTFFFLEQLYFWVFGLSEICLLGQLRSKEGECQRKISGNWFLNKWLFLVNVLIYSNWLLRVICLESSSHEMFLEKWFSGSALPGKLTFMETGFSGNILSGLSSNGKLVSYEPVLRKASFSFSVFWLSDFLGKCFWEPYFLGMWSNCEEATFLMNWVPRENTLQEWVCLEIWDLWKQSIWKVDILEGSYLHKLVLRNRSPWKVLRNWFSWIVRKEVENEDFISQV